MKRDSKVPSDQDNKQKYIYILIGIAVLLLVHSIYKKKRYEAEVSKKLIESAKSKLQSETPLSPSERAKIQEQPKDFSTYKAQIQKVDKQHIVAPMAPPQKHYQEKSKRTLSAFKAETYLEFAPPKSFQFAKLDLDGNFTGIYGEDSLQNTKITGLAYKGTASAEDAFKFLRSDADSFPNLAKNPIVQFNDRQTLPKLPESSGLAAGTLWTGKLRNGDSVAAVFMQRSDKQGAYLFVVSGPQDFFKNNDGAFDSIYDKAKALTPPMP